MAQTVDAFAARAATLPRALVEATPGAVRDGGQVLERAVRSGVAAATGGDSRLSRVRSGKGAAIRVDLQITGSGSRSEAHVVPRGPIMLVELPTKAHRMPFVYTYNRRVRKRRASVVAFGGQVYGRVRHPGTAGKYPVRKAFESSGAAAGRAGVELFARAAASHLSGA